MAGQRSFLNAVKWSYTLNWGERAFSALFTFVLAGILGPKDFGMVSIAMVYVLFLQMFLDQGLVAALIQKKHLDPEHLDAVFWMDVVLSLVLVGISALLGSWWARANHSPEAATFIFVLSLSIPIQGLSVVQNALLQKEMDFRSLSIRSNVSVIVSGVVGLSMAFGGFHAWALVGQQLVRDATTLLLLWKLSPWRPRLEFSWKHLTELMHFSVSNFLAQLGIFADMQAGSIILGLIFGPVAVGLYRLADRFMNTVVAMATSSIQSVALPEFSRLQDKPEELRKSALSCVRLSATVTVPALTGLAAVSTPLMAAIGPSWMPAADVLKILCVLGTAITLAYFTGPLLQALSRPHHLAILEWARTAAGTVILVIAGLLVRNSPVNSQLIAIASARFVTGVFLITPIFVYLLMRLCKISFRELTATIAPSVAAAISIVLAVVLLESSGWLTNTKPIVHLIAEVAFGGIVGVAALLSFEPQLRRYLSSWLQRRLSRRQVAPDGLA